MYTIDNWHSIPWKQIYEQIQELQGQCVMAYYDKDRSAVYKLQRKLVSSFAARAMAVRRITTSSGSSTSGIDKIVWDSPNKRWQGMAELKEIIHSPKLYQGSPVKRIYIPKVNSSEMRPLGIPTMIDRAVQAIYQLAVDPIVESQSDPNSYGFRAYRSTHDAITRIRTLLDKTGSPKWILDADIAKCFDTISHDFLLKATPICDKDVLSSMLKSGIIHHGVKYETLIGTPQGGVISPLLCNVALNGLEDAAKSAYPSINNRQSSQIHLTRYADDFVCTSRSESVLKEKVMPAISRFLEIRGLTLKKAKTRILRIEDGFDFLGFTIQRKPINARLNKSNSKQTTVLLVRPRKSNQIRCRDQIRRIVTTERKIQSIVRDLNPILRGWSEYYRISYHSLPVFWTLGHYVYGKMWKWCRKRHPKRNAKWIYEKYVQKQDQQLAGNTDLLKAANRRKWIFGEGTVSLFDISNVTQFRVMPIKQGYNPYIRENIAYYEMRREAKIDGKFRSAVYKQFSQRCPLCNQSLHNGEPVELHHLVPEKDGGRWKLNNIQPLHKICHQSVTYVKPAQM